MYGLIIYTTSLNTHSKTRKSILVSCIFLLLLLLLLSCPFLSHRYFLCRKGKEWGWRGVCLFLILIFVCLMINSLSSFLRVYFYDIILQLSLFFHLWFLFLSPSNLPSLPSPTSLHPLYLSPLLLIICWSVFYFNHYFGVSFSLSSSVVWL